MQQSNSRSGQQRTGVYILVGLALLTGVEYIVAIGGLAASFFLLALIALAKTAMIVSYFMHAGKLFQGEEGEH